MQVIQEKDAVFVIVFWVGVGGRVWFGCRSVCQSAQQAGELTVLFEAGWEK